MKIINLIVMNGSEEAKECLLQLLKDRNPLVKIMAGLGIEMSKHINSSREAWGEYINYIQKEADSVIKDLFSEEKHEYLEFLEKLNKKKFKSDFRNIKMEEIIGAFLIRAKEKKRLEEFLFKAVEEKRIKATSIYPWLYSIGDKETLREIKRKLKRLELEDGIELRALMEHLEQK